MASGIAARTAWRRYGHDDSIDERDRHFADLWALVSGEMFNAAWKQRKPVFTDITVYKNTRLVYKHVEAIALFYAANTYQGTLSTDGSPLPDGSPGAIPLVPQAGTEQKNQDIRAAVAQCWNRWNWQEGMTDRPYFTSVLGETLTELVDDPPRNTAWPQTVWPGYVVELDRDEAGNVKRYVVQHPMVITENGQTRTITFRREIDNRWFRYYRDGAPWDKDGDGAVVANPYGFAPAIWDRHRRGWGDRGLSAIAGTRQALIEINSIVSHALDYQRRPFNTPVILSAGNGGMGQQARKVMDTFNPWAERDAAATAETQDYITVPEGADVIVPTADIGQTLETITLLKDGILDENPEANFYPELRKMSSLDSAPAVERAMGDVVSRLTLARAGYDTQSVKLFQMALAICGYRLNSGAWRNTTTRDAVFRPFDLGAYRRGDLDMVIRERPVVPMTEHERLELLERRERLQSSWALGQAGIEENDIQRIRDEREIAQF